MEKELNKMTEWGIRYKDIPIKICHWREDGYKTMPSKECWTYYLMIHIDTLPKTMREKVWLKPEYRECAGITRGWFPYTQCWLNDLDWHCGITYYGQHIINGDVGSGKVIEVGCDFQHLWDREKVYDVEFVLSEAKKTVDSLIAITTPKEAPVDDN